MSLKTQLTVSLLLALNSCLPTKSSLEFCYNGPVKLRIDSTDATGNVSELNCPYGLLFKEPVILGAIDSLDSSEFCIKEDVCGSESWTCTKNLQYSKAQILLSQTPFSRDFIRTSIDNGVDKSIPNCSPSEETTRTTPDEFSDDPETIPYLPENDINDFDSEGPTFSRKKRQILPPSEDKGNFSEPKIQFALDEQTKRMFYYLSGINSEEIESHLRVVQLFRKSIRLVHMICDSKFLNEVFLDNIEKAFMFLMKEQGFERIADVDDEDFKVLSRALEYCMADPTGYVEFIGSHCLRDLKVTAVKRNDKEIPFTTDETNFVWGKFDMVVDSAWQVVDIVHGMCFATFRENLNLHHKYQVVMEQLFHDAVSLRWNRVTTLKREQAYSDTFMVSLSETMQVMDACAQGAYIGSPFLHRLNRPIMSTILRRKRSLSPRRSVLEEAECIKSEEDLNMKMAELKKKC